MKVFRETPGHDALHLWFELSYAAYLTIPRTVLQSMPDEWQGRLADLLYEADEICYRRKFSWPPEGCVAEVKLRRQDGRYVEDPFRDYQRGRRRLWRDEQAESKPTEKST